jgi:hypothetical protein
MEAIAVVNQEVYKKFVETFGGFCDRYHQSDSRDEIARKAYDELRE